MSRRRRAEKRQVLPDARFGDQIVTKFMNCLMRNGKKSVAEKIVYGALAIVAKKKKTDDPLKLFHEALDKVKPYLEVRSRRVGGATYQVPVEVRPERATALAIRWIIDAARNRSEKTMTDKLAGEIMDAIDNRGSAVKKREDTHKMAEANKAFAFFRW
ncbi:MAG: 30S ribosomal protein S7 [Pseudomonadota bacterium]|nr:30S ribosomal protein S7 [Pseudomonadota bacterium]